MSEQKYIGAETLKQHLFMEATLGYIKTLGDVNRVIDTLPEADPQEMARQLWRDAKSDPPDPMVDVIAYCADGSTVKLSLTIRESDQNTVADCIRDMDDEEMARRLVPNVLDVFADGGQSEDDVLDWLELPESFLRH